MELLPQIPPLLGAVPVNLLLSFPRCVGEMAFEHLRRSSRIPKQLSILLIGSDMEGKSFSEMTKTVLLSRHGAGIISIYKLSAEQEIILRYLDTNKEAVIRVVGQIGSQGDLYTYGVAFLDSNIDFWGIDFPPATESERRARRSLLECGRCKQRETVDHTDMEADVLMVNEGLVRFCKNCGDSTFWKRVSASAPASASTLTSAPASTKEDQPSSPSPEPVPASASAPAPASTAAPADPPPLAPAPAPEPKPALRQENRRKHARMKVSYKACIRRSGFPDDVVPCEDMSKGGICFKSRKRYYESAAIEVAVPYSSGNQAIFVPAQIVWVQELPSEKFFRCGVAYRLTSKTF